MSRRNRIERQRASSHCKAGRASSRRRDRLSAACAGALRAGPLEHLESRTMLTIVQPAAQDFLAFEAEHAEAVFTDPDANGFQWQVVGGSAAQGASTLPSGGAAILANRAGAHRRHARRRARHLPDPAHRGRGPTCSTPA